MAEQTQQTHITYPSEYIAELLSSVRAYFHQVDDSQLSKRKEPETPMDPEDEQESKRSKYRK
jgi:hypothetical protein